MGGSGRGVAAVLAAASTAVLVVGCGGQRSVLSAAPGPLPAEIGGVPTSELMFEGMQPLACGVGPLAAYTASGDAENASTPAAAGLRDLIAHDVTGGESPQHPGGWVLLAERGGTVTFAQRTGTVGLRATVVLKRQGERYVFAESGGCGPLGYADGSTGELLDSFSETRSAAGDVLTVRYTGGTCDDPPLTVRAYQHADVVDLLAVHRPPTPLPEGGFCAGVGIEKQVSVRLDRPLGGRRVRAIAYVPDDVLPSDPSGR